MALVKILPHSVPELIFQNSTSYGALDFKVCTPLFHVHSCSTYNSKQVPVNQAVINTVRGLYINTAHTVFDLVPQRLSNFIEGCYDHLGCPALERGSIWGVYLNIISAARQYAEIPQILASFSSEKAASKELALMSNQRDLPNNNSGYMGGVGNGYGLHMLGYSLILLPCLLIQALEQEHHRELDELDVECEHAGVELEDNEMDIPPLIVTAFSDEEDSGPEDEDEDDDFVDT
jgi:hypothetical protein